MGSSSFEFIGFALIVVVAYQLFRSALWRKVVLLTASCWFLSTFTHDYRAYIPFIAFLTLGYLNLQMMKRAPARAFLLVLIATILLFVWLKKYSFFPAAAFLSFPYLTVGLSYILFRILHLTIDTHNGLLKEPISPLQYLVYTINFTTLVSGPIQKYSEFTGMVEAPGGARPSLPAIGVAVERIVRGFFKTNVLALILSDLHTSAIAQLARGVDGHGHLMPSVVAFASYPLFLYCNFSGYIDIVIGIARLLGITLPENFNRPFSSDSFIGFWSRWHITLSEWMKTYVYNPFLMALMRRYPATSLEPVWAVLAFFVTFFLIGIWHGQTAAFLFFGFLQGLGVSMNKLYQILMTKWLGQKSYRSVSSNSYYVAVARGFTFTWFTFTLLWFWSNWSQIGTLFSALGWKDVAEVWLAILFGSSSILAAWEALRGAFLSIQWQGSPFLYSRYWRTAWNTGLVVIALVVVLVSNQPAPEIVYKAF
jgi:D-alanyl-lipoteichoic acid acyltransferase DltB (MBOAT superfamily)